MTPNPRFLFLSGKHEEALASLSFGIEKRKGFIVITGEIGTGKTTICRALIGRLKDVDTSLILNPSISEDELLTAIVGDFGLQHGGTIKDRIDTLNRFLLEGNGKGRNAVIIIDESQHLSLRALEMVRLLSNLETEREKLLQIIFFGQPELRKKLESKELKQLNQRIAVKYHLAPLDRIETHNYIFHRIKVAGGSGRYLKFTDAALDKVYSCTGGYPRLINVLCDRVLMAAYVDGKRVIDRRLVLNAAKDIEGSAPLSGKRRSFARLFGMFGYRGGPS